MPGLNDLERQILDYMVQYLRTNTYQPSIREIGERFRIKSTKTVSEYLSALADKGYLERDPSRSRGVRMVGVDLSPETISVPCYGVLPDGSRGRVADGVEARYSIDRRMAGAEGCYFVRARGSEFSGAGIDAGDLILVEPATASDVRVGDLVVVQSARGNGLYRYLRNGEGHLLEPAAVNGASIALPLGDRSSVTGRVAGLFRSFERAAVPVSPTAH